MPISRFETTTRSLRSCFWAFCVFNTGLFTVACAESLNFPVAPELFLDEPFNSCEGIAFNGEGVLFVTCNQGLWRIDPPKTPVKIAELDSNLGVAGIGAKDLLVADFGPTNAFRHDRNTDGVVWRISPDGAKAAHSKGFGDPNFIVVRRDGSYLVSDDATSDIYHVTADGAVSLFTTSVNHPNGLVFSQDESVLFVAQMFTNIRPVVGVSWLWSIDMKEGKPMRDARLEVQTGPEGFADGLALDEQDRVYIAANREGRIWRYDPKSRELVLIAEGVFGAGSLVFGEGDYDPQSLYLTTTFSQGRGGKIWRIPVGVKGASVTR